MTEIIKTQNKKIKLYSDILDNKKRINIINILKLFNNSKLYNEYNTSVVDWLENQLIFFLDPYGFNNKYSGKRKIYLEKMSKLFEDCEYKNLSLDKIVLFLFTFTNEELKAFYKINKSKDTDKSLYNIGLRKLPQNGGGYNNNYVSEYIYSLQNEDNFKKIIIYFNYINQVNNDNIRSNYSYIAENLNIKELYIDIDIPFVNIDKLFIYLLNIPIKKIDNLIVNIKRFFIKFEPKKELLKYQIKKLDIEFSDKNWVYKKIIGMFDISYKFYKLFDNKLVNVNVVTSFDNNIRSIIFMLFNSSKERYIDKYYFYYYFNVYNATYTNKYGLKTSKKAKEIFKIAINDIKKYFGKL